MIYLDNAASTRVHPDVAESMVPYMAEQYGNPSSIHRHGRLARKAVERARRQVALLIGADPSEILLTSGGTESNNTALLGAASGGRVITTSIEHDAVLEPCRRLARDGLDVVYLVPDRLGMIHPKDLEKSITDETRLVSIMFGNNEVGTIQPVADLARICRSRGVLFHTDAVQVAGKVPINVGDLKVDMLSLSSHKLYGPKGAGALYVRGGVKLNPVILGGGQESGMRSGTENVAGIVGFGRACEIAQENLNENALHMKNLRDELVRQVLEIPESALNGHPEFRLPNSAHFTFLGVNGEDLIIKLDEHGIAASTGSACSVHTQKASHVLQAMGFSLEQITGSLRMTVGIFNTREEISQAVVVLGRVVTELRAVSPFREKYSF
ncbi:MAG: cysteine desulfurase [Nitrosopumilus sp. B06]|nr:MAG: cysteine desulfurase [Nitrosopumilus sp. B06]